MNNATLIGNLVRDPELRATQAGIPVCVFTIAVNRRSKTEGAQEADYFRVTTWRGLAENCGKYLAKGRKVGVTGTLSLNQYKDNNGLPRYSMEVQADEVEFLTPRGEGGYGPADNYQQTSQQAADTRSGFVEIDPGDDLPF